MGPTFKPTSGARTLDETQSALAAVEQATSADRVDVLRRVTKDMLPDPARRIELDDVISHEVQRVAKVLKDPAQTAGPLTGSNDEIVIKTVERAAELWQLAEPFCASLQVAARWGTPDLLDPWVNGLRAFLAAALRIQSGNDLLLGLRHLPGMVGVTTATLAAGASRKWANVRALVVEPTVRDRHDTATLSLVEATSTGDPFGSTDWVSSVLARTVIEQKDPADALADYTQHRIGKYYTAASEWLHRVLRPLFIDQIADDETYDAEFDRMEAMLGVLAQDRAHVRGQVGYGGVIRPRSYWFGRATWRVSQHRGVDPVRELSGELAAQGTRWGPLEAGLFGGDEDRAQKALEAQIATFDQATRQRSSF